MTWRRPQRWVGGVTGAAAVALMTGSFLPWMHAPPLRPAAGVGLILTIRSNGLSIGPHGTDGFSVIAAFGSVAGAAALALFALLVFLRPAGLGTKLLGIVIATLTATYTGAVVRTVAAEAGAGGVGAGLAVIIAAEAAAFLATAALFLRVEPPPAERWLDELGLADHDSPPLGDDPVAVLNHAIADARAPRPHGTRRGEAVMTHVALATTDAEGRGIAYLVGVIPSDGAAAFVAAAARCLGVQREVDDGRGASVPVAGPRPRRALMARSGAFDRRAAFGRALADVQAELATADGGRDTGPRAMAGHPPTPPGTGR